MGIRFFTFHPQGYTFSLCVKAYVLLDTLYIHLHSRKCLLCYGIRNSCWIEATDCPLCLKKNKLDSLTLFHVHAVFYAILGIKDYQIHLSSEPINSFEYHLNFGLLQMLQLSLHLLTVLMVI